MDTPRHLRRVTALALLTALVAACAISTQQEVALGRDYTRQLDEQLPLVEDPTVLAVVRDLGREFASHSSRGDLPWEFQVVNTDAVNAFAVPGGFIYMNRGLLETAEGMAEIAGVMAHEVGHIEARHSVDQLQRLQRVQVGLALGSIILGSPDETAATAINVAANLYFAKHSRDAEAEADRLAVELMLDAGWNPRGLIDFFRHMIRIRGDRPGALAALFASHPITEDRIASTQRILKEVPPQRLRGLRDSSPRFDELRASLSRLPPPPAEFRAEP